MRLLFGALLLGAALPAASVASAAPAEANTAEARLVKARALVALVNPNLLMVKANVKGWEASMGYALTQNPTVVSLERQYPGISKAAIDAARPIALHYCERFVAEVTEQKAKLFAERLDSAELDALTNFFSSPAGKRLITRMIGNLDSTALGKDLVDQAVASGRFSISDESVQEMERKAVRATMGETSADDHVVMLRFQQSPAATKYAALVAEADKFMLQRASNPDPEWIRKQSDAMNAALLAFVDARKKSQ